VGWRGIAGAMRNLYRVPLIVAITIACNVTRPLPPPSNPASATLLCDPVNNACLNADDICHVAVGGGTCALPCADDAYCDGIVAGYVCHMDLQVCAPSCSGMINGYTGDAICIALGSDISCGSAGLCVNVPPAQPVGLRIFNGTSLTIDVTSEGISALAAGLVPGGFTPLRTTVAGARTFNIVDGRTGNTVYNGMVTRNLLAGHRYLAFVYKKTAGYEMDIIEDVPVAPPPSGEAWLQFLNLDTVEKDLRRDATPPQSLITILGFGEIRGAVSLPAGVYKLLVGASPGLPATMSIDTEFVSGKSYVVITWANLGLGLPETVFIGADDAVIRSRPAGIKLVNAIVDAKERLSIDGVANSIVLDSVGFVQGPATGYLPIAPGAHTFATNQGAVVSTDLADSKHYSVYCYGAQATATPSCSFVADEPAAPAALGYVSVRAIHLSNFWREALATVDANVPSTSQVITVADFLPYAAPSEFVALPTASPIVVDTFNVSFVGGPPKAFVSPILNPNGAYTLVLFNAGDMSSGDYQAWLLDTFGNVTALQAR